MNADVDSAASWRAEERPTLADSSAEEETIQQEDYAAGGGTPPPGEDENNYKKKNLDKLLSELNPNDFTEAQLNAIINTSLDLKIDESVQQELVRLVRLVKATANEDESSQTAQPRMSELSGRPSASDQLRKTCLSWAALTIAALLKSEPDMVVARGLMTSIETELLIKRRSNKILKWIFRLFAINPMIPFASGILFSGILGFIGISLWLLLSETEAFVVPKEYKFMDVTILFAFFGAATSLIVKLPSAAALQDQNELTVFWTTSFKPLVGVLFGVVVYFVMKSGVIKLMDSDVVSEPYIWGVVGFIAGWSERFASDIIDRAAERISRRAVDPRPGVTSSIPRQ